MQHLTNFMTPTQNRSDQLDRPDSHLKNEWSQQQRYRTQRVSLDPLQEVQPSYEESQWVGDIQNTDIARLRESDTPSGLRRFEAFGSAAEDSINSR